MKLKQLMAAALCAVGLAAFAAEPDAVQLWEGGPYFATCNVGADTPEGYGILTNFNDAAQTVTDALGTEWRVPTDEEFKKLAGKNDGDQVCSNVWTTCNGVKGCRFFGMTSGYEDKNIFLPAAGYDLDDGRKNDGDRGYYWSSVEMLADFVWLLRFDEEDDPYLGFDNRSHGLSIRAVRNTPLQEGHDLVVLKADGTPATDGYSWTNDVLFITNDGLTVTGTTTTERVEFYGQSLVLKDLSIAPSDIAPFNGNSCILCKGTDPATVNIEGEVKLNAVSNQVCGIQSVGSLIVGGAGNLAVTTKNKNAILAFHGDLSIAGSVNITARNSKFSAFGAKGDIAILSTGRIDARAEGTSAICANEGKLTIGENATNVVVRGESQDEYGAIEFYVDDAVTLPAGWAIFGSTDINAADEALSAFVTMKKVEGGSAYTGYIGDDFARAVTFGPASETGSIFPEGDGGKFVPAAKVTVTYNGAVIAADGVMGTVELKMKKPNKRTGLFNIWARVKMADKKVFSFKAKKVAAPADGGPLTVTLVGSNKKSKEHALTVTLEGNSLKGTFDDAAIDGASDAFKNKKSARAAVIAPFIGTWTGAFTSGLSTFSAKVKANGRATVKVVLPNGKTASCSAKAEVGDGVIAVPVTVRKSVKGAVVTFGFRLAFGTVDGKFVCEAVDVAPLKVADKKTGAVIESTELKFLVADAVTVTAKEFKTFVVAVDPVLTEQLGPITKNQLKFAASTGLISGSLKFGKVSAKAAGIVIGDVGIGTVTVKKGGMTAAYAFRAMPAK